MDEKQNKPSLWGRIFGIFSTLALLVGVVFWAISGNIAGVKDILFNLNYAPPVQISQIADNIELTDSARVIFYSTRPEILDETEFNNNCTSRREQTAVLGCYSGDRIFVYNVKNADLEGVKEATAAHELLHATWARLSHSEREEMKHKLADEYERIKTPELESLMAQYSVSEPGEHENELHSILATEIAELSPELEQYYTKYFKNRQKVVQFYANYSAEFQSLEQRAAEIASEMDGLKAEIEAETTDYQQSLADLNDEIDDFNANSKSGYYTSEQAFYADREALQARSQEIEVFYQEINAKIDRYNSLISELEQVSVRSRELNESINSKLVSPEEF